MIGLKIDRLIGEIGLIFVNGKLRKIGVMGMIWVVVVNG